MDIKDAFVTVVNEAAAYIDQLNSHITINQIDDDMWCDVWHESNDALERQVRHALRSRGYNIPLTWDK